MRSLVYSIVAALVVTGAVWGAGELAMPTRGSVPSQTFAPNGELTTALTKASTIVDARGRIQYMFYSPSTCKVRYLASTVRQFAYSSYGFNDLSTVYRAYPMTTFKADAWYTRAVNKDTPFIQFTSCKSGTVEWQ